jgi:peptide/nickel transport system substrate-binding protein
MSTNATTRNALAAVHRTLYNRAPETKLEPRPDLATGPPQVSDGGRRVIVRIRTDAGFGPPLNRRIVADDFKYAIERLFSKPVAYPFAGAIYGDLVGVEDFVAGEAAGIAGIETPDDATIVFRLARPTAGSLIVGLVAPESAPVPREYARRFDRGDRSTYGAHQVPSGPYMFEARSDGEVTEAGYEPGVGARLVRNPGWDAATDERPAHLDAIAFRFGNDDAAIAVRRIVRGSHRAGASLPIPPDVARSLTPEERREAVTNAPVERLTFVTFNTSIAPFDDLGARRAAAAAIDRETALRVQGGPFFGTRATHFIPTDVLGHAASNAIAAAVPPAARYDGQGRRINMVAVRDLPAAETLRQDLVQLGFDVRLRLVPNNQIYEACGTADAEVNVCLVGYSMGGDPQRFFATTFGGASIAPVTSNFSRFDDPAVNAAIRRAAEQFEPGARARAFAEVNRLLLEAVPALPLIWTSRPAVHSPDVRGAALLELDYSYSALD